MASHPNVIVFDFDGVILESADIKTRAFRKLFEPYSDCVDAIIAYHETHAGISRYEKFRHVYQNMLMETLSMEEEQLLGKRFSDLVKEEVIRCSFVPGALEFLRAYSSVYPLFVASGTPEEELRDIVTQRGLLPFFRGVFGSPKPKREILAHILEETKTPPQCLLFVGDGMSDYQASGEAGVAFVGRCPEGGQNPFKEIPIPVFSDLFGVERYVRGGIVGEYLGVPHVSSGRVQ